jgi:hypothetical protein
MRLPSETQHLVRVLAALLRVAISLDRSHDQRVRGVGVRRTDSKLVIEVTPRRRADVSLELYSAHERVGPAGGCDRS